MMGYICAEHGLQKECDVSKSGERICPECGEWVNAVGGRTRDTTASPPEGESGTTAGDIRWTIVLGYGGGTTQVNAHGYIEAIEAAIEKLDEPQEISEVYPTVRRYRGR